MRGFMHWLLKTAWLEFSTFMMLCDTEAARESHFSTALMEFRPELVKSASTTIEG